MIGDSKVFYPRFSKNMSSSPNKDIEVGTSPTKCFKCIRKKELKLLVSSQKQAQETGKDPDQTGQSSDYEKGL